MTSSRTARGRLDGEEKKGGRKGRGSRKRGKCLMRGQERRRKEGRRGEARGTQVERRKEKTRYSRLTVLLRS